ncbi:phage tail sheath subtilisin-like domain-containing protein [Ferrovibrio sp.]|uniref:phage tail sheath subtilisin-like domain-containing protein n=1 Tax=Ferrovibrio sp. TaxID=1917215 RepID=UPI0035B2D4C6
MNFETIAANIRLPGQYVEISAARAVRGLPGKPHKILLLGQRLATGSVAAGTLTRVTRAADAQAFFGRGSMLANMCAQSLKTNGWTETWALGLADLGAGVAATFTHTVTGPATAAGTLPLYVNGTLVPVGVAAGDSASVIAGKIAAAVTARPDLECTAAAADAVATMTCRHKGLCGNDLDFRYGYYPDEVMPAGVSIVIAAGTAGAGNPDVLDAIAALGDTWWTEIAMPWTDSTNLNALQAETQRRWGGMVKKGVLAYCCRKDTYAGQSTFGSARNNGLETFMPFKRVPTAPWIVAASYAALAAFEYGIDPARPLQNVLLPGVLAPAPADRYTEQEMNLLLYDGMSAWYANDQGQVFIARAITTYQKNSANADDTALMDVDTLQKADYVRYAEVNRIALRFPRHALIDDANELPVGKDVVRPKDIDAELAALGVDLQRAAVIENLDAYNASRVVQRDPDDPDAVNVLHSPDFVNALRIYRSKIQFVL